MMLDRLVSENKDVMDLVTSIIEISNKKRSFLTDSTLCRILSY